MELISWCRTQWDRALATLAMLAGMLLIAIGWIGVSGTPFIAKQVPYIVSGGLGGLALLVVAATLWLSADFNDEWRALDALDAKTLFAEQEKTTVEELEERLRVLELTVRLAAAEAAATETPARRTPGQRAGAR